MSPKIVFKQVQNSNTRGHLCPRPSPFAPYQLNFNIKKSFEKTVSKIAFFVGERHLALALVGVAGRFRRVAADDGADPVDVASDASEEDRVTRIAADAAETDHAHLHAVDQQRTAAVAL